MYTTQVTKFDDPYADTLARQQYKMESFVQSCLGRAKRLAEGLYNHIIDTEKDKKDAEKGLREPPGDLFDHFVLQLKSSLGPPDPLLHWIEHARHVRLRELTPAGFDEFLALLINYIQRVTRAHFDEIETLRNAARTGGLGQLHELAGFNAMTPADSFQVNALSLRHTAPRSHIDQRFNDLINSAKRIERKRQERVPTRRQQPTRGADLSAAPSF
jgi:hypothetical protein